MTQEEHAEIMAYQKSIVQDIGAITSKLSHIEKTLKSIDKGIDVLVTILAERPFKEQIRG